VAQVDAWAQAGLRPSTALRTVEDSLRLVQFDVPDPSSGLARSQAARPDEDTIVSVLRSLKSRVHRPVLIGISGPADPIATSACQEKIARINRTILELDRGHQP
jgi:hypothetical protein